MTVADRIAVMDHGRIVQMGTPAEIYEQPASRHVAEFVGDVNLIEATVAGRDGGAVLLQSGALAAPMRAAVSENIVPETKVALALRPEKIRITVRKPGEATENVARGAVIGIAYLGDLSIYQVRLESGQVIRAARPNVTRVAEQPIARGDKVYLSWTPEAGVVLTR